MRKTPAPIAGLPVGRPNDLAYFSALAPALAPLLLMTEAIAAEQDRDTWRTATLALLAGAPDLSFLSVWSPTFLTTLLDHWEKDPTPPVLHLIADGGVGLPPNPARARQIEGQGTALNTLWPKLSLISAWADASASEQLAGVRNQGGHRSVGRPDHARRHLQRDVERPPPVTNTPGAAKRCPRRLDSTPAR